MPSPKLENIKRKHPRLCERLEKLWGYIAGRLQAGSREIVPALAARYLDSSEAEALGLLMLFDKEKLILPVYNIYCREKRTWLTTVSNKADIPEVIECKFCEKEHTDPDELEVELVFQVSERDWEPLPQHVSVS